MAEDTDATPESTDEPDASRVARVGQQLLGLIIVLAVGVAAIWVIVQAWPDTVPEQTDPSWIDSVFASKPVLFATRLVLFGTALVVVVGGVYTITSMIKWMQTGHWLRRIGPFEVAEQAIAQLTEEIEQLRGLAESAEAEIAELQDELQKTQALADHFYEQWQEAEDRWVSVSEEPANE